MRRLCMWFTNKPASHLAGWVIAALVLTPAAQAAPSGASAPVAERDPVTLSVVAVNPSAEKVQVIPVRIDLPQEIKPADVLETGELSLEYDEDRAGYFVYKESVALQPKETRVFEVRVRDVWYVPQPQMDSLNYQTNLLLGKLKESEYFPTAKELADSISKRLGEIQATQDNETLSRKSRIGAYRYHLQTIEQVKEDIARMEKLLTFIGGPPIPEMMEESPLKSDAPSTTTTWLVIFLIIVFIGLLGGQFFFTWNRRGRLTKDVPVLRPAGSAGSSPRQGPSRPA